MPSHLVETFLARCAAAESQARERRARCAAEETRDGIAVRFERSIHVPRDEFCFFTFVAPSAREAALVARRADLESLRVVEAISSGEEKP